MERRDMRSIKAAAKEELGHVEGVEGVGLGENSLRVYVKNAEVRKRLPSEFRGLPVDFVITGDISALGAASS
jgi:hypothetical protein